jgi:hypothetical protein
MPRRAKYSRRRIEGILEVFMSLKLRRWIRWIIAPGIALLLSAAPLFAATITVTSADDTGAGTLRQAIVDAASGDTINFSSGFTTIILTSDELLINKSLTINGSGANLLTVVRGRAPGQPFFHFRIFDIIAGATVTISGLTIVNGNPLTNDFGGGIFNFGTLTVVNCTVSGNSTSGTSDEGGGIYNGGTAFITNSIISGNFTAAFGEGGGIYSDGITMNITNSTISGNSAKAGSGIFNTGGTAIINSTVSGNSASSGVGGGIYNFTGGMLDIANSTVSGNSAITHGGIENNGGTMGITNSTISGNSALGTNDGGMENEPGGTVNVRNTIIAGNTNHDFVGTLTSQGYNLIGNTSGTTITGTTTGNQLNVDPHLGPLQDNGGPTFTQALLSGSTAIDGGSFIGLHTDQRGFTRPVDNPAIPNATGGDGSDIGAFEVQATFLANISTRLLVETGDNVLIGGFIIIGTQPKKVIVRAIGPSLPLAGKLADPVLELHGPAGFATLTNDNWRSDQEAEIIATGIPPTNDLESAIVATLPANGAGYTAIVRGVNNGTGIGLVEAYDLDNTVDSKLANISTRGLVQTGDNVLIAGTIIQGPTSQQVLVRAIGPSLALPGKLADPTLELHDGNGALIAANDNWRSDQEAAIIATGIPPTNDLESAIVETLPANGASYTAIVRGVNGTTGVALVEIYALN